MKCLLSVAILGTAMCCGKVMAQPVSSSAASDRIEVGMNVGRSQVREDAISSTTFKGVTAGAALRYEHGFGRNAVSLEGSMLFGQLQPKEAPDASGSLHTYRGDLIFALQVNSGEKIKIDIGPSLGFSLNNVAWKGLLNVSRTEERVAFFSFAAQVSYSIEEGDHGWVLTERMLLPLVSAGKRTLQASGSTEVMNGSGSADMQWRTLGGFFSFFNRISIHHALGARSSLGAEYTWNLGSFGGTSRFIRVDHNIGVTFTYQF